MADNKPKNYIIVFKKGTTSAQIAEYAEKVSESGGQIGHRYYESPNPITNGFSAKSVPDNFMGNFQTSFASVIDYIEEDQEVSIQT